MRKVLSLLVALVAAFAVMASSASAYVHEGACQMAARGNVTAPYAPPGFDWDLDDDIHNTGVRYGYRSFAGWGGSIRANSYRVWLHLAFTNVYGQTIWMWDTCYQSGQDDQIVDIIDDSRL
jgi:hypothetical protein